jgi:phage-related tail fiber protein
VLKAVTVERDNGKTIETITREPDGTLISKSIEQSNDEGTEIRITEYDANDAIKSITLIARALDSYGNWVVDDKYWVNPKDGSKKLVQTMRRAITYY